MGKRARRKEYRLVDVGAIVQPLPGSRPEGTGGRVGEGWCNFSSHVDQIFDEASLAASIVRSNMSDDFSCMRSDHRISRLVAKFIKLPIISPFGGIIRSLPTFLLWQTHVGKIPTLVGMSFN